METQNKAIRVSSRTWLWFVNPLPNIKTLPSFRDALVLRLRLFLHSGEELKHKSSYIFSAFARPPYQSKMMWLRYYTRRLHIRPIHSHRQHRWLPINFRPSLFYHCLGCCYFCNYFYLLFQVQSSFMSALLVLC